MFTFVKWVNFGKIFTNWSNMICNNINHYKNSFCMCCFYKILQVLVTSKIGICFFPIGSPVSMVSITIIINMGRDPDSVESHSSNVIQMIFYSFPSSTTIIWKISAGTIILSSVWFSKSVSKNLINSSSFPLSCISCGCSWNCSSTQYYFR